MKKTIAVLLSMCLALALAACGGPSSPETVPEQTGAGELRWRDEPLPLPEGMAFATAQCVMDGKVYLAGRGEGAVLGWTDMTGESGLLQLPEEYEYLYGLAEADGTLAVLAGSYPVAYYDADGNLVINDAPQGALELLRYDLSGALLDRTALPDISDDGFRLLAYTDGDYYLLFQNTLAVVDGEGAEIGRLTSPENIRFCSMCLLDGRVLFCGMNVMEGNSFVYELDREALALRVAAELPEKMASGMGVTEDGGLLISDDRGGAAGLSRLDLETGVEELLFPWYDSGCAEQSFRAVTPVEDGYLFYQNGQTSVHLVKSYRSNVTRTELVVATDGGCMDLYKWVSTFNSQNESYKIRVTGYGYEGGLEQLRIEMATGKAPDIYAFGFSNSLGDVTPEGAFEDLFPYLDADPEYGRDTLVPSLLKALTASGNLYWLPQNFSINTLRGAESVFGGPGITMDELDEIMRGQPNDVRAFPIWMSKTTLLQWVASFAIGSYVDEKMGTCHFDDEAFVRLLEGCNRQAVSDEAALSDSQQYKSLLELESIQNVVRIGVICDYYGGDYCYVGFPNEGGNGSMFSLSGRLGISAQSAHKDGAWQFVRTILLEENQQSEFGSLPVVQRVLEKMVNEAAVDGIKFYDSEYVISQEDVDKFWELVDNTTVVERMDDTLNGIIQEEAQVYFDGGCTAEEAAVRIQSRASLYLAEKH